ncbi:MAG TPA: hypothetical protein VF610_07050, partial [Segetibacter sp.]
MGQLPAKNLNIARLNNVSNKHFSNDIRQVNLPDQIQRFAMILKRRLFISFLTLFAVCFIAATNKDADVPRRLEILFLGHKSKHH